MKSNILGALVILLITVAIFLMMDDISNSKNPEPELNQVEVYEMEKQPELATNDQEEEED